MTDAESNAALSTLADRGDLAPAPLFGTGKATPYFGWFWRYIDFSSIPLARPDHEGADVPPWAGFCANNKWDYPEWVASQKDCAEIRALCEAYVADPTRETALAVFERVQRCEP